MNKKKHRMALAALLTALSVLLSGCLNLGVLTMKPSESAAVPGTETAPSATPTPPSATETGSTEAPPETANTEPVSMEPIDPNDEALIRWQNAGQKDYLPDGALEMVRFSEMEYRRPDVEQLYADFDALIQEAKQSGDAASLLEDYYELYSRYISFYSMDTLANIRYSLNTADSYFKSEYDFCQEQTPNVEEKLEALNKALAASPARDQLEEEYFGSGYFEQYDDYEVYTNPEYLRLSQEEAALLSEYRALTADMQVSFQGETKPLDEWLETDDYSTYIGALQAYYDSYNASVGELFVRLVKVRQQLAAALDYDSYADYSFDVTYGGEDDDFCIDHMILELKQEKGKKVKAKAFATGLVNLVVGGMK